MTRISRPIWSGLALLTVVIVSASTSNVSNAQSTCCAPTTGAYVLERTYSGRIYFKFPNYTVYSNRSPQSITGVTSAVSPGPTVVYRNANGLAWNGGSYLEHPAYNRQLVTKNLLAERRVGAPLSNQPSGRAVGRGSAVVTRQATELCNHGVCVTGNPIASPATSMKFATPTWVLVPSKPAPVVPAEPKSPATNTYISPGMQVEPINSLPVKPTSK